MSWGMALSRGLTGLATGLAGAQEQRRLQQERAEQKEFSRMIADREWQRQLSQDRQQAEQTRLARERQGALDTMGAVDAGYRPVGSPMDDVNAALGLPDLPTVSIGGQQMRKSANSTDWTAKQAAQAARGQERAEDADLQKTLLKAQQMFEAGESAKDRSQRERLANVAAGAKAQPKLRAIPAGTIKDYQGINANMREIADALETANKDPEAFKEALGFKNMLPEWMATRGMSEGAMAVRGKLSNLASGIFLERSGAAVTPSEAKRLEGWTANMTDTPEKAKNALENILAFYQQKAADMGAAYDEEAGYHALGRTASAQTPAKSADPHAVLREQAISAIRQGASAAKVAQVFKQQTGQDLVR